MMYRYLLAPFIFHFYDAGNMHALPVLVGISGCIVVGIAAQYFKRCQ